MNWFINSPVTETAGPRCRFVCRIGQRQLSDNGICVRDTEKPQTIGSDDNPVDCTVAANP